MSILPVVLGLLEKGSVKLRRGSARVHRAYASCVEVKNSLSSKFQEKRKKCAHTSFEVFASSEGIIETPGGCQSGVTWHADVT
jgi:hypothetical protein